VNVLAVGAHPDDIEIGCAGALAAHRLVGHRVAMLVMTSGERGPLPFSPAPLGGPEVCGSRSEEQAEAAALLGASLYWGGFDDGAVPDDRAAIDLVEGVARHFGADTVYTHSPRDTHQDHRATSLASMAAVRRFSRVLFYESPTTTSFDPVVYVDVADHMAAKLAAIRAHLSQVLKNGLVDLEAVEAQARYRGFMARIRHAEAFESDRFVWNLEATRAQPEKADDLAMGVPQPASLHLEPTA